MNEDRMVPLSESLADGPLSYLRFLHLALPLTEAVGKLHTAGSPHGGLDAASIRYDGAGRVELPAPSPSTATCDDDLKALGGILYYALTGVPVGEKPDPTALKRIYPVEAKLTVEKLLGLHPSGQFASAAELHASLVLMKDVYQLSDKDQPVEERTVSAKVYLSLSLIALILVLVWIIISIVKK
jgi:hypothetical protein